MRKGKGKGNMKMEYADVLLPTTVFQLKDPGLRAGMYKGGAVVELRYPYLTNPEELLRGDSLGL